MHDDKKQESPRDFQTDAVPKAKDLRLLWLTLAVLFLCLLGLLVWFLGRSPTPVGVPRGIDTAPEALPAEAAPAGGVREPIEAETDRDIVFYRKSNDDMKIALTFDDGPHPYYTPLILDILAEYGVKATFFMIGENVTYYPAAAEAVLAAGHEVGNHTYHHRRMKPLGDNEILQEIEACEDAIASIAEYRPKFLRPPEGEMNLQVRHVVGDMDYRIILWDLDTRDWAHTPPAEISRHILDEVQAGDIILMHDFIGHDSPTPEALRLFIPELLSRGYQFVTVGELLDGS